MNHAVIGMQELDQRFFLLFLGALSFEAGSEKDRISLLE